MLTSSDFANLLSISDFFLAIIYLLFFIIFIKIYYKKSDLRIKLIAYTALALKTVAVIINCILIDKYWKTGDSLSYFSESQIFYKLISKDFLNIKYLVLPFDTYKDVIGTDNVLKNSVSGAANEANFMVTRFTTIFYMLSGGRFLIINLFFSFLSLIGQVKIIEFFRYHYPKVSPLILSLGIIFAPSLLFFSSPIYKETLCIGLLGIMLYAANQIYATSVARMRNIFLVLFCAFVIFIAKDYIIYSLFVAAIISIIVYNTIKLYKKNLFYKVGFIVVFVTIGLLISRNLNRLDGLIYPVVENLNHFQDLYIDLDNESSTFKLGDIDLSFMGLVQRIPKALYTCIFRPHIWEITKPILIINSLESIILLFICLYILFFRFTSFSKLLSKKLTLFLFIYSLIFFSIVGLTTFNFGTMVRYKNPGLIFFNVFLILCLYQSKKIRKITTADD